jgi:hypothetical protein
VQHVTRREAAAVLAYANSVAKLIGLPRWRITLADTPCSDDSDAVIQWVHLRNMATISLSAEWMTLTEDRRRDTITHEVLHLAHAKVSWHAQKAARRLMTRPDHQLWWRNTNADLELMVDMLAGALSETTELRKAWRESRG